MTRMEKESWRRNVAGECGAKAYHAEGNALSDEMKAAEELRLALRSTLLSESLSNSECLRILSSLREAPGGRESLEEIAASAATLLVAVSIDFEDYRRNVDEAMSELRSIVRKTGFSPQANNAAAWAETHPYSKMEEASSKALSSIYREGDGERPKERGDR